MKKILFVLAVIYCCVMAQAHPDDFMFQLTKDEFENWKSQFVISNSIVMGARKLPYAFTEHGISMLSGVLHSVNCN